MKCLGLDVGAIGTGPSPWLGSHMLKLCLSGLGFGCNIAQELCWQVVERIRSHLQAVCAQKKNAQGNFGFVALSDPTLLQCNKNTS